MTLEEMAQKLRHANPDNLPMYLPMIAKVLWPDADWLSTRQEGWAAFHRRRNVFDKTKEENKRAWLLHVANTLGFQVMPTNLQPLADVLYDHGYRAYQAVDHIKRWMTPNAKIRGDSGFIAGVPLD